MRPTCLICNDDFESEMAVGFSGPEKYWICSKCLADARLGAMVRRIPNYHSLERQPGGWFRGETFEGLTSEKMATICEEALK